MGGAPTVSAAGKKSNLHISRVMEASPIEAEMHWQMGTMPRMVPAYTYHVKAYKYYLVVKKNPNQRPCVRNLLICSLAFLIWKELQKMCHPCYFIEAQTEHREEVICHMLVAKVGLEHRSADPQAIRLCTTLSLNPLQ